MDIIDSPVEGGRSDRQPDHAKRCKPLWVENTSGLHMQGDHVPVTGPLHELFRVVWNCNLPTPPRRQPGSGVTRSRPVADVSATNRVCVVDERIAVSISNLLRDETH